MAIRYHAHIRPSEMIDRKIRNFQERYPTFPPRVGPHLTTLTPCELLPGVTEEGLIGAITVACSNCPQLMLATQGIGSFDNHRNVHIKVIEDKGLRKLISNILHFTKDFVSFSNPKFSTIPNPHITIANYLSSEQGMDLIREAEREIISTIFPCTLVYLMKIRGGEHYWSEVTSFKL